MHTLVCFALQQEAGGSRERALPSNSQILITGIGKQNARRSFQNVLQRLTPQRVLTCGFAGGLNPDLKLGDVVFELSSLNPQLSTLLTAAGAKPARFFCADRIAITTDEKRQLRAETGADAVEMESAAIHAVCREHGIACATVRVISDTAHEDLPLDFNALAKPDLSLDYPKLAWTVLRSPGKIGALRRFQKQTQLAAKNLAEVLGKVIEPP
jgi:adenosylhomocysteine nucleosidase